MILVLFDTNSVSFETKMTTVENSCGTVIATTPKDINRTSDNSGDGASTEWCGGAAILLQALLLAVRARGVADVQGLLRQGAFVDCRDGQNNTPLSLAAHRGHSQLVQLLIAHGADVRARNANGFTPLHEAARNNHADAVRALLSGCADVDDRNEWGATPLWLAVENDCLASASALLDCGAYTEARAARWRETPLILAARLGREALVRRLVKGRADVNAVNSLGQSALHVASCRTHSAAVLEFLSGVGAHVDANDAAGRTALSNAVQLGNTANAEALVRKGAEPLEAAPREARCEARSSLVVLSVGLVFKVLGWPGLGNQGMDLLGGIGKAE